MRIYTYSSSYSKILERLYETIGIQIPQYHHLANDLMLLMVKDNSDELIRSWVEIQFSALCRYKGAKVNDLKIGVNVDSQLIDIIVKWEVKANGSTID